MLEDLSVPGALVYTTRKFSDDRGLFLEWFKSSVIEGVVGHALDLRQANMSMSAAGVIRGVHFSEVPPGQAKYVTCIKGAVLDVVVDLRLGSPTFGQWDSVLLDDVERKCVYIPEGLGHAFMSLDDDSVVTYLCSSEYSPDREHGVNPLDPELGIDWPSVGRRGQPLQFRMSAKDSEACSLTEARDAGLLPRYDDVLRYVESLAE